MTLDELLELIAQEVDEVTLLEVLELTSHDIVNRFSDRVEEKRYQFAGLEEEIDEY